jgi:NADPH-dependent 2,4-dienoyl-CoA reductase/sulfur reductase-like enzyme
MEPARANIDVRTAPALAPCGALDTTAPQSSHLRWPELSPDVLIVGAGPAGLSAARVAAASGLQVLVVDERSKAGGQFFKQPGAGFIVDESAIDAQFAEGRQLYRSARTAGADFMMGTTVWGAFAPNAIAVASEGHTYMIKPRRLILATGAYERAVPVPGWTLPGVMTTGAAQTLLRAYQIAPGNRVIVAGNGPLNLQVAYELVRAGVEVVAIAETAAPPYVAAPGAILSMATSAPKLLLAGLAHVVGLRMRGVRIHYRHALVSVEGQARAERATLAAIDSSGNAVAGTQKTYDVDAVCVNHGFLPQSELARSLGCAFRFDARNASFAAERGEDGRTNVDGVFIVGDAGGMRGARVAIAQGAVAGAAVAAELGASALPTQAELTQYRKELRQHGRFQDSLWQVFGGPTLTTQLAGADTLICRCEEVDRAGVEDSLGLHAASFGMLKRATRVGMGRCQGRYCATSCAQLMATRFGTAPRAGEFFAPRGPFKPMPISCLAGETGDEIAAVDVLRTNGRDANILS